MTQLIPSDPIFLHVWGKAASFTRYDTPAETDTYPMLTVPAADGLLSSIHWHPGFHYEIRSIRVLSPVQIYARQGSELAVMKTRGAVVPKESTPRMRRIIHQPSYLIEARMMFRARELKAGEVGKHWDILHRRIQHGQAFEQPFFGLREFACHFEAGDPATPAWDADADLGPLPLFVEDVEDSQGPLSLTRHERDMESGEWQRVTYPGRVQAHYFDGVVRGGVLHVPAYRERFA